MKKLFKNIANQNIKVHLADGAVKIGKGDIVELHPSADRYPRFLVEVDKDGNVVAQPKKGEKDEPVVDSGKKTKDESESEKLAKAEAKVKKEQEDDKKKELALKKAEEALAKDKDQTRRAQEELDKLQSKSK